MTIQTFYPIFEHGQVLTSSQLNTMVDYLEQQDRLSRRTLSGIGIVCGFEVDRDGLALDISGGAAVTSEGYLITADAQRYNRVRPYAVPVPTAEEASADDIAAAQYPFLFDDDGVQIPVLELVDTDFEAAPGEDDPTALTAATLNNAVVMLFLEAERAALKSCDVNDCSDKGAERRFALRRLLLTRAQAEAIVAQETQIAGQPTDKGRHPRLDLPYMRIEKLALAREGIGSFNGLIERILTITGKLSTELPGALRDTYAAYGYLLEDMYAPGTDVFPDSYFDNLWGQFVKNPFLAQYFYDYLRDVAMAYNEFGQAAMQFEAVCMPNPDRFPRHVLLGDVTNQPDAYARSFSGVSDVLAHDKLKSSTGAGLAIRPALRRTHFIPSPAHDTDALADVRALFTRMHLLAMTFKLDGLLTAPIRVTPSRDNAAPLSERAIPFHYAFDETTDLFRNWSPRKTRQNLLNTVYSYRLNPPDSSHPLFFRIDDQDFYRVEGVVGRPLGTAMAELIGWKRELGIGFGIEPVYMRLSTGKGDDVGDDLDFDTLTTLLQVLRKLLLCRMSEFDALLLLLLKTLFAFLVFIVRGFAAVIAQIGQQDGTPATPAVDAATDLTLDLADRPGAVIGGLRINELVGRNLATARLAAILPPKEQELLKVDAEKIRKELASRPVLARGDALKLAVPLVQTDSIGEVFEAVKDDASGGNLFDRTKAFVAEKGGGDAETQVVYAQVAMLDQGDQLMRVLNVDSLADFDEQAFDVAYRGFAGAYQNYGQVARAMPDKTGIALDQSQQLAAAADTIASDNTAFALGNLQNEVTSVLQRILSGLVLDRYAQRHPGLEHSAGVPEGGTLVLAYTGRRELAEHLQVIGNSYRAQLTSVGNILGSNTAVDMAAALRDLQAAVGPATDEPLDQYVVLADFCLPYKCCDADCSDIELSRQIVADPFGKAASPGPMAVPPITGLSGGASLPELDLTAIVNRPPIVVVGNAVRRAVVTDLTPFERPENLEVILARAREGGDTDTPIANTERATVFGQVVTTSGRRTVPVPTATITMRLSDGTEQRVSVEDDGSFKVSVPIGRVTMRATAPRMRLRSSTITVDANEEREVTITLIAS